MIRIHVAVDSQLLRDAFCVVMHRESDFALTECTLEGMTGLMASAALKPDVVVLCDEPRESPERVVAEYRAASPRSKVVLLLLAHSASELQGRAGADAVVEAADGVERLVEAICSVAQ